MAGNETAEELTAEGELCFFPDRYCTVWVYLNDTEKGGHTCFHTCGPSDYLYEELLPQMCKVLGMDVPKARSLGNVLEVQPKAGMAVLHFPTTNQKHMCLKDSLASHEGCDAVDPKYIMQQFIWSEPLETVMKKYDTFLAAPPPGSPIVDMKSHAKEMTKINTELQKAIAEKDDSDKKVERMKQLLAAANSGAPAPHEFRKTLFGASDGLEANVKNGCEHPELHERRSPMAAQPGCAQQ
eukprot:4613909-Prymnesium_polylepis.1